MPKNRGTWHTLPMSHSTFGYLFFYTGLVNRSVNVVPMAQAVQLGQQCHNAINSKTFECMVKPFKLPKMVFTSTLNSLAK